ncbi:hypothetical protein DH2020_049755 [Rehmannia glutinosa]|uniref:Uncharacterized protein n=1 Tax=Rehmannia glutinosa TaxID=99300 RepID=A0ABR0U245_REHGL
MKKVNNNNSSNSDANNGGVPKQKERHIVSWSQEEDDILREQIRIHGTEKWFTYLNSDFKKGGWSPEEDMLLCEAQKIFGNRWTEIAKVVSGRTDNAVKNRFTTLCKKRAKREALAKENNTINLNNKRVIFRNGLNTDGGSESAAPVKKIRTYISNPFQVLAQSVHGCMVDLPTEMQINNVKGASTDESVNNKNQRTFLKKDDPKVLALMQQAELLGSLAIKVNTEKTDQSLENAWMVLQDYLKQNKESDLPTIENSDTDFQLEKFKELVEDLRSCNEGSRSSWRDHDVYDSSPSSSEYSTGSTLLSNAPSDKTDKCEAEICALYQETGHELKSDQLDDQHCLVEENGICRTASRNEVKNMLTCDDMKADNGALCEYTNAEFSSPLHVTPFFRTLAAAIPSPKFSESVRILTT